MTQVIGYLEPEGPSKNAGFPSLHSSRQQTSTNGGLCKASSGMIRMYKDVEKKHTHHAPIIQPCYLSSLIRYGGLDSHNTPREALVYMSYSLSSSISLDIPSSPIYNPFALPL